MRWLALLMILPAPVSAAPFGLSDQQIDQVSASFFSLSLPHGGNTLVLITGSELRRDERHAKLSRQQMVRLLEAFERENFLALNARYDSEGLVIHPTSHMLELALPGRAPKQVWASVSVPRFERIVATLMAIAKETLAVELLGLHYREIRSDGATEVDLNSDGRLRASVSHRGAGTRAVDLIVPRIAALELTDAVAEAAGAATEMPEPQAARLRTLSVGEKTLRGEQVAASVDRLRDFLRAQASFDIN